MPLKRVTAIALTWVIAACQTRAACEQPREAAAVVPEEHVVARWSDGEVQLATLEAQLREELRDLDVQYQLQRYELLHRALDSQVRESLLERERVRRGLASTEELIAVEVDARTQEPSEAEVLAEFERIRAQMPETTFESMKPHLAEQLRAYNRELRREQFLRELRSAAGLEIDFPYPAVERVHIPVQDHDPVLGPASAAVTIVEFAEYQCYYCADVAPMLQRLVDEHPGKVRVVFKDFPNPTHEGSRLAAVAAHCAGAQGKYWEMGKILLKNPSRIKHEQLRRYADGLGLDGDRWESCMREPVWNDRVDADIQAGRRAGVGSTPTFFVNGLVVIGAQPYERFVSLVEQELSAQAEQHAQR
jgi:protein-disulfide isomerase